MPHGHDNISDHQPYRVAARLQVNLNFIKVPQLIMSVLCLFIIQKEKVMVDTVLITGGNVSQNHATGMCVDTVRHSNGLAKGLCSKFIVTCFTKTYQTYSF